MPSGAKRRKAAKKKQKKKTDIPNGNGEAKVIESDHDLRPQRPQDPFSTDEHKEPPFVGHETKKDGKGDADMVEIAGEVELENDGSSGVNYTSSKESTNGSFSGDSADDGSHSQVVGVELPEPKKEPSKIIAEQPESFAKEVCHVEDTSHFAQVVEMNGDVLEKEIHAPEGMLAENPVGSPSSEFELLGIDEEKVHPIEKFSDVKAKESVSLSNTNFSEDTVIHITNGESYAGNLGSGTQLSDEKEPLLLTTRRPVNKTSWTSCCGLLDVFTGSSKQNCGRSPVLQNHK